MRLCCSCIWGYSVETINEILSSMWRFKHFANSYVAYWQDCNRYQACWQCNVWTATNTTHTVLFKKLHETLENHCLSTDDIIAIVMKLSLVLNAFPWILCLHECDLAKSSVIHRANMLYTAVFHVILVSPKKKILAVMQASMQIRTLIFLDKSRPKWTCRCRHYNTFFTISWCILTSVLTPHFQNQ